MTNNITITESKNDSLEKVKSEVFEWPSQEVIPLNLSNPNRQILTLVKQDINESENYLIITGFTSLGHIIDFFGCDANWETLQKVRIVIGWEPKFVERDKYDEVELEEEVKSFWLSNSYSIIAKGGGYVIRIIELINNKILDFRIYNSSIKKLHAKIYIGEKYAQSGSANFSSMGLTTQFECMTRFSKNGNKTEKKYYENLKLTAENYYRMSDDFNTSLSELLKKLLAVVTWQEALARAINEILELNSMYEEISELHRQINSLKLWPSQRLGLHQALMILQKNGCVLIADPTGSGKTKMISALQMLLFNWLVRTGRQYKNFSLIITPPLVKQHWRSEFSKSKKFTKCSIKSMGVLSNGSDENSKEIKDELIEANILIIDEAHNYLNQNSNRSKTLSTNLADYVILSTATPINRNAGDLLRTIELLGLDNLRDDEIDEYKRIKSIRKKTEPKSIGKLQSFISKILLRRTKPELRKVIAKNREAYKDKNGRLCAYPTQKAVSYRVKEENKDRSIAKKINSLASELKGIIYLQTISPPDYFNNITNEAEKKRVIDNIVDAANKLSIFNLQATMRSSKAALLEHLVGTEKAEVLCELGTVKRPVSGNIVEKLETCKNNFPKCDIDQNLLPSWLQKKNIHLYRQFCEDEIKIYQRITGLAEGLSSQRELSKIKRVLEEFKKSPFIVAFDSIPITLHYMKHLAKSGNLCVADEIFVVTGNTSKEAIKIFGKEENELFKNTKRGILFCSDVLSEGIGLQRASSLFFLDIPSVVRLAEQRIGRIERLDSLNSIVKIFWPIDSKEFVLKADSRLLRASNIVEALIGANFKLPKEVIEIRNEEIGKNKVIDRKELEKELKKDTLWDGIEDSFKPVYNLYAPKIGLIMPKEYEQLRGVKTDIKLKVSKGFSENEWCFIALKSTEKLPPEWVFIERYGELELELPKICEKLRENLGNNNGYLENERISPSDWHLVEEYIQRLREKYIEHLPNKKRRAIKIAKRLLKIQIDVETDNELKKLLKRNSKLLNFKPKEGEEDFDFERIAELWLDVLIPQVKGLREIYPRNVITLNDLTEKTFTSFTKEQLEHILKNVSFLKPIWERITSLIISVPYPKGGLN